MGKNLTRGVAALLTVGCRYEGCEEAEQGRVGVDVVEGSTVVDLWVVVQDVGV